MAEHRITLQRFIQEFDILPNNFVTETGIRVQFFAGEMSDGTFSHKMWQTDAAGNKIHLMDIKYGATPEEAKENLKQSILKY